MDRSILVAAVDSADVVATCSVDGMELAAVVAADVGTGAHRRSSQHLEASTVAAIVVAVDIEAEVADTVDTACIVVVAAVVDGEVAVAWAIRMVEKEHWQQD